MKTGIAAAAACATLALAAGCGSSSKPAASTGAGTTASTGTTSTKAAATTAGGASIKVDTTPKFAAPSKSAPVQSGVVQIAYRNIAIAPDTVRVKVGSTIRWTNYDSIEHNVTSKEGPVSFKSQNFGEGGTFHVRMTKPGVVHYECTIHPASMNGTIEVVN